jgi:hypothetical protein
VNQKESITGTALPFHEMLGELGAYIRLTVGDHQNVSIKLHGSLYRMCKLRASTYSPA